MKRFLGVMAAVVLALGPARAAANGCLVADRQGSGAVRSAAFRAIYVLGAEPGITTAVVQTAYVGTAADFAWIYPLPAPVVDGRVGVVPAQAVARTLAQTDPQVVVWDGGACGSKGGDLADTGSAQGAGVTVLGEYDAGPYEVLELSAQASADLSGWLQDQGYAVDAATEPLLDTYAQEGWSFLVVTLGDAAPAQDPRGLPALAFSYGSEDAIYPLRISTSTTSDEVETLIVGLSAHRVEPMDDTIVQPDLPEGFAGDDFATWYRSQLRLQLAQAEIPDGGRAWGLEYAAGAEDSSWGVWQPLVAQGLLPDDAMPWEYRASRYHAWLTPDQMDRDVWLVRSLDQSSSRVFLGRSAGGCALETTLQVLLGVVLVGGLGLSRRARSGPAG